MQRQIKNIKMEIFTSISSVQSNSTSAYVMLGCSFLRHFFKRKNKRKKKKKENNPVTKFGPLSQPRCGCARPSCSPPPLARPAYRPPTHLSHILTCMHKHTRTHIPSQSATMIHATANWKEVTVTWVGLSGLFMSIPDPRKYMMKWIIGCVWLVAHYLPHPAPTVLGIHYSWSRSIVTLLSWNFCCWILLLCWLITSVYFLLPPNKSDHS